MVPTDVQEAIPVHGQTNTIVRISHFTGVLRFVGRPGTAVQFAPCEHDAPLSVVVGRILNILMSADRVLSKDHTIDFGSRPSLSNWKLVLREGRRERLKNRSE